ncbi:hypothetical protein TNIN_415121 [Trichonephila inaurata madagascariensis]|uniref:Uncharacterized protein n=1 Tax=Trichonephila inaurata madagascariensis TaxID=2747483 RepID=A0A8X6JMU2_9ARAC|nr:hypothetical protein TNIN_415121 [Trichonephila inaurata madagascariensis]
MSVDVFRQFKTRLHLSTRFSKAGLVVQSVDCALSHRTIVCGLIILKKAMQQSGELWFKVQLVHKTLSSGYPASETFVAWTSLYCLRL